MHKKILKDIGKDLDYLKTHDKASYENAETHLNEIAGYTSVARTTAEDKKLYKNNSAMSKVRDR